MTVVVRGFVFRNDTENNLEINVYNENNEKQVEKFSVPAGGYSEGKVLTGFTEGCTLRFESFINGEDYPATLLEPVIYNAIGEGYVVSAKSASKGRVILDFETTGYTRAHFYNSAAVVSSFEVSIYPGGNVVWESSDKPVGQSADIKFKDLGLKDLTMLKFEADVTWGANSTAGPILFSKTGDRVAGFELKGTAFSTSLNEIS